MSVILIALFLLIMNTITITMVSTSIILWAQEDRDEESEERVVNDSNLKVETIVTGLEEPTSMAFLGPDDMLILEKNKGTVQRIVNGEMADVPVLDVSVANKIERGMLGISVANYRNDERSRESVFVYLYYTESSGNKDGLDDCPKFNFCEKGNEPLGNRLYRYEFINDKLVDPELLLDLPATPGPLHNGGTVTIGPDDNIYLIIGNVGGGTQAQNIRGGEYPDGRSGIIRVTQDGRQVGSTGVLADEHPLDFYYAYGIRNSFGIDFDPITDMLWDTEVGNRDKDEVNLVRAGFNSGSHVVQGMSPKGFDHAKELVNFEGKGSYSDPELTWNKTVTPTSIKFLNSTKLGEDYENDVFIGDFNNGNIYHFDLNKNRTQLLLEGELKDKVVDTDIETNDGDVIFAKGFGGITDLEVGPDGNLYVVSISNGNIYRITPEDDRQQD
jgi:aldose sugar dehydrogenase